MVLGEEKVGILFSHWNKRTIKNRSLQMRTKAKKNAPSFLGFCRISMIF
jgi:hypothetical protein